MNKIIAIILFIFTNASYAKEAFIQESLVEFRYKTHNINEVVTLIKIKDINYICLRELLVDTGVELKVEGSVYKLLTLADGEIARIDLKNKETKNFIESKDFNDSDTYFYNDELFVSENLLSKHLLINLKLNSEEMIITYEDSSLQKIPVIEKLSRSNNREIEKQEGDRELKLSNFTPRVFSPPGISFRYNYNKTDSETNNTESFSSNYILNNEFLGFDQVLSIKGDASGKYQKGVYSLKRFSESGLYPGIDANEIHLFEGTFNRVRYSNVDSTNSDFYITNGTRDNTQSVWLVQDFRGKIQEGWSVELYINGKLIGFKKESNLEYLFKDVQLRRGNNNIEKVFIGPLGEIIKEKDSINLGRTSVFQDKTYYSFSYDNNENNTDNFSLLTNTPINSHVGLNYGVSKTDNIKEDKTDIYQNVSLMTSFLNANTEFGVTKHNNSGSVYYSDTVFNFRDIFSKFNYEKRDNFEGEFSDQYKLTLNSRNSWFNWSSSYEVIKASTDSNRFSFSLFKDYEGNNINYSFSSDFEEARNHNLQYTRRIGNFNLASKFSFSKEELSNYNLGISSRIFKNIRLGIGYEENLNSENKKTSFFMGDSTGIFNKSLNISQSIQNGQINNSISASLGFRFGNILNPVLSKTNQMGGEILVIAYFDSNYNGTYDSEDVLAKEVSFDLETKIAKTNKNGEALFTRCRLNTPNRLKIDPGSMGYSSSIHFLDIQATPNSTRTVYYPVFKTFELEGIIKCEEGSKCSGQIIHLENLKSGEIIKTFTSSGGFFYKDKLPMGEYKIFVPSDKNYKPIVIKNYQEELILDLILKK